MFVLGLTGSIGMGKSTTAQMFAELGCAVWDADAAVHRLYGKGGKAVSKLDELFPDAVENGAVSRSALRQIISHNPDSLKQIEAIVHPLVAQDRREFLTNTNADIAVLDIPLLFEGGKTDGFDAIATVYIGAEIQKRRVMERGTMTEDQFNLILSKQMPADEKALRADYVIVTDTVDHAREQVAQIVSEIRGKADNA